MEQHATIPYTDTQNTTQGDAQDLRTIGQYCAQEWKRTPNTVRMAWSRNGLTDFNQKRVPTPHEVHVMTAYYNSLPELPGGKVPARKPEGLPIKVSPPLPAPAPAPVPDQPTSTPSQPASTKRLLDINVNYKLVILCLIFFAPTAASVQNINEITMEMAGWKTAVLYTVLISFTPIGFVISGVKRWYTFPVAGLLILYEIFCNVTAIYRGLMQGPHGNPVRFLGTVTEIFNTGTYGTALFLGAFVGVMLAAVQFTSLFSIKKLL